MFVLLGGGGGVPWSASEKSSLASLLIHKGESVSGLCIVFFGVFLLGGGGGGVMGNTMIRKGRSISWLLLIH